MQIQKNEITALIGPSGCGKSTFLKTLDRMNDLIPGVRITGQVLLQGQEQLRELQPERQSRSLLLVHHTGHRLQLF